MGAPSQNDLRGCACRDSVALSHGVHLEVVQLLFSHGPGALSQRTYVERGWQGCIASGGILWTLELTKLLHGNV